MYASNIQRLIILKIDKRMKKVLLLMTISILALTSCSIGNWEANMVEPSDNIVTKEYKLKPF